VPRLAALFSLAACGPRYAIPTPPPLALTRPARAIPVEVCAPSPEPSAPTGGTPLPTTEGDLALLDVRGDDRLGFVGPFVATWSADGEHLITATLDSVLLWSVRTGALERRLDLGTRLDGVRRVVVSPDDSLIAVSGDSARRGGSSELSTWLLRASGAAPAQRLAGLGGDLHFTPDSRRLIAQGGAWDFAKGARTITPAPTSEALFLPDGRRAIVLVPSAPAPHQRLVPELRDLAAGASLHRFPAVDSSSDVALSGDGRRVAILDGALSIYATDTFERIALVPDVERAGLVQLSYDGRRAVIETLKCAVDFGASSGPRRGESACAPPALAVWDVDRGERLVHTADGAGQGWVFSRDGAYLTGSDTRLVEEIVRVKDGARLRFGSRIRSISPDSRRVLFDGNLGLEVASLDDSAAPAAPFHPARGPRVLARSADGRHVAAVDDGQRLRLEGPQPCARLGLTTGPWINAQSPYDHLDPESNQVAFSNDGASLFTVTNEAGSTGVFRAFRASDGGERWSVQANGPAGAWVLPGADQVIFQGGGRFELLRFDAATGAVLPTGRAPGVGYARASLTTAEVIDVRDPEGERPSTLVSPAATRDGRSLATFARLNNAARLSIWDPLDPRRVIDVPAGSWPSRLALSPDERLWAAAGLDGEIRLFARDGSQRVSVGSGGSGRVTALVFSRAGDRLVAASEDGGLLVVSTSTGTVVGRARLPLDRATSLWISPDDHELWADTARAMRVRFRLGE
jgi:WD40 repeat protein